MGASCPCPYPSFHLLSIAHHPHQAGTTTMEIFPGAYVAKQSLTAAIFLGAIIITILAYRIDSSVREASAVHPKPAGFPI